MNKNVLIIEDEEDIANLMILYLKKEGIHCTHCISGEDGLRTLSEGSFDLLLLDINLPGINGFETLKEIRTSNNIAVMIISARREEEDMLTGFGVGADDYVTKPFSPGVLTARIMARLHRQNEGEEDSLLHFGPIDFDPKHYVLKQGDERIDLSRREMDLLVYLSDRMGQVVSKDEIYHNVWGNDYGDLSTVTVHIQRIRKKIEKDPANPQFLKTKYGYGYFLESH